MGVLKRTLKRQIEAGALLSPLDLQSFLHRAAGIANERPLTARSFSMDDFWAISPRDLLLGAAPSLSRTSEWQVGLEEDWQARLLPRVSNIEEKVRLWWKLYSHDVFPLLVPLRKWQLVGEVVDLGAIVMVQYTAKFARDRYRLARVMEIKKGRDGLVRSVLVGMRDQRKGAREPALQSRAGLSLLEMPVQRLIMILPGRYQPQHIVKEVERWMKERQPQSSKPTVPQPALPNVTHQEGEEEILDL